MAWFILIVILVAIFLIFGRIMKGAKNKKVASSQASQEAVEIAASVDSIKKYMALTRRYDRAEEALLNAETEKKYENAHKRHELLGEAIALLDRKPLAWQFIPVLDLTTPADTVKQAYKIFTLEEYEAKRAEIGGDDDEWMAITPYYIDDDQIGEEPNEWLKAFARFRAIVEGGYSKDETIKKINQFAARNNAFMEESFDPDDELSIGAQWFRDYQDKANTAKG